MSGRVSEVKLCLSGRLQQLIDVWRSRVAAAGRQAFDASIGIRPRTDTPHRVLLTPPQHTRRPVTAHSATLPPEILAPEQQLSFLGGVVSLLLSLVTR